MNENILYIIEQLLYKKKLTKKKKLILKKNLKRLLKTLKKAKEEINENSFKKECKKSKRGFNRCR